MNAKYYDGTNILNMKDIDNKVPEIYIVTTNRTGGKTTYFNRLCINRFLKQGKKFCLLYRYQYELEQVADKFFKDIKALFFNDYMMDEKTLGKSGFKELFIGKNGNQMNSCGYAISLNASDNVKKYSHFFNDTELILFDEFQTESNRYINDEVGKLLSVHTSLARGNGKQVRYLPVFMLANQVTLLNPYYSALGIAERLNSKTHFLRGNGWVLETDFIESAANAQKESAFNRAFASHRYTSFASENNYLLDNYAFIERPHGRSRYICTFKVDGSSFSVREFPDSGILYCDDKFDPDFPTRIAVTLDDHSINYVMLSSNNVLISFLRDCFQKGKFRFKNANAKNACISFLSFH